MGETDSGTAFTIQSFRNHLTLLGLVGEGFRKNVTFELNFAIEERVKEHLTQREQHSQRYRGMKGCIVFMEP